jgi:hypothetical protein
MSRNNGDLQMCRMVDISGELKGVVKGVFDRM